MRTSEYYFYSPKSPQFFFPKREFKEYNNYYRPFSIKSKVFWFLYKNSVLLRSFFRISEREIPLPIAEIKEIINLKNATYFYNIGSVGVEQKATIIAKNKEQERFLKFGQKKRAKELIANESRILLELKNNTAFKTASVFKFDLNEDHAYVLTEVIVGEKINFTKLNDGVFQLLLVLAKNDGEKENDLKKVFAHGDFCPWNMLQTKNNELVLIDWEMAGLKPLGYDLFTYLFQTNFLLFPTKTIQTILVDNKEQTDAYFKEFQITDWREYLISFANSKINSEQEKGNSLLLAKYQELHMYNE